MRAQQILAVWPSERLMKALWCVIDENDFSPVKKRMLKRKLAKLHAKGMLTYDSLDTVWLYRLCAAALMLHDYCWLGWEWRSNWAHLVSTRPWVWPRWDGERRRVLVVAEQGIGDEILFSSCYHELAADVEEAWVEVEPRLIPLFRRSFPENLHFVTRYVDDAHKVVPRTSDYPDFHAGLPIEAFIPTGGVPKLYRHSVADFPVERRGWLVPDPGRVAEMARWLRVENAPMVGCSWRGRQGEIDPVKPAVSLQYDCAEHGGLVVPPLDLKRDVDGVCALCAALDKVVTTTNAVAHMAGAVGAAVDLVKPWPIYAREEEAFNNRVQPWWPDDRNDFYPNMTVYRSSDDWRVRGG